MDCQRLVRMLGDGPLQLMGRPENRRREVKGQHKDP